ncbi:efflux RND transporter periplasmic adaptor subunit [Marinicella gelatinilytica]|uniref:efflux RND transporter periplasmic adaptor subunit n=1 Tax=Marinicella gelatinilytica TaxID=2996017 RepID=UPI0022610023|nr:efflux RND transporter periplasmic adaptor subunit [Marinicella gelatinilytica]MCX7545905.1 efflux RND transporter periplasmic adaptor subunit [Marinicella gelatinilytica]
MKNLKITLCLLLLFVFTHTALAQQANPVIVALVKATTLSGNIQALGDLQAINNVNLTSQVTDYITEIYFEDGQRVSKGDTLIVMDTADEQALLAEEQARLDEAQRQVNRLNPLIEKMAASRSALDTQKSLVAISKARIQGIQTAIDKRTMTAPFDGVVGLRQISVGSLAQPGMQLATLDQDSQMKLDFTVSADQLSQLQPGLSVSATTTAYPDKTFTGTLVSLDSRVNPVTRMIRGRVIIDNQDFLLKTGLLMRVNIAGEEKPAILIPEEALISEGGQHYVFVTEQHDDRTSVRKQAIKIGDRPEGQIAVVSGLEAGQQVVIHGALRIHDGSTVTITAVKKADERLTELLQQNRSEP